MPQRISDYVVDIVDRFSVVNDMVIFHLTHDYSVAVSATDTKRYLRDTGKQYYYSKVGRETLFCTNSMYGSYDDNERRAWIPISCTRQ